MKHAATLPIFVPGTGLRVAILALVLYVSFLIAAAPASVLGWALAYSTDGAVKLERAEGSVWSGRAAALLVERPGRLLRYEGLAWEWDAASLAANEFAMQLRVEDPHLRGIGRVAPRFDGVHVSNALFKLPASSLAAYLPVLGARRLSGEVTFQSTGFTFSKDRFVGVATVEWRDAATTLSSVRPLGDYRALVAGTGARTDFELQTVRGALRVEGHGTWSAREPPVAFRGTARAGKEHSVELAELLNLLGPDRGGGTHRIDFGMTASE